MIDIIGEHFCHVGLIGIQLRQMAEGLGLPVDNGFTALRKVEGDDDDDDEDNVVSLDEVKMLLRIASMKRVSLEEIIGYFMGLCSHQAEFFEFPNYGDIDLNKEALQGFQKLIVKIMDIQDRDISFPVTRREEETMQESSDKTGNDF